jgi:hypothetical protein
MRLFEVYVSLIIGEGREEFELFVEEVDNFRTV